jgi:hypothetical protein
MIPQAIANTGPYAGLWSDLKSMRHAVDRVLNPKTRSDLTELDQARLRALAALLRTELDPDSGHSEFLSLAAPEPRYSLDFDLRKVLRDTKIFEEWHRASKLGFREKTTRLIAALEDYLPKLSSNLFASEPPREEFAILDAVLSELLRRTETELIT